MKLAEEIIDALGAHAASLTDTLMKTKILLHRLGLSNLAEWVNFELTGYPPAADLPPYRILPSRVLGNIANTAYMYSAHPIPIAHLSETQREYVESSKIRDSLAVLEELVRKDGGRIQAPLPMEMNSLLSKNLGSGFMVQQAWCEISPPAVKGIIVQVRSRLLDFLLALDVKLPNDLGELELKNKASTLNASEMFRDAIFGSNTNLTIVIGNNNNQDVVNSIKVGDGEALAIELRKLNMPERYIAELKTAIVEDELVVDHQNKQFGPRVKAWFDSMIVNAANASWQIELNFAAGILTTKLQAFYGWLS